jgi:hypothetical protein
MEMSKEIYFLPTSFLVLKIFLDFTRSLTIIKIEYLIGISKKTDDDEN